MAKKTFTGDLRYETPDSRDVDSRGLERALKTRVSGEVRFDKGTRAQWLWVAGSGPKVSPASRSVAPRISSRTIPGCTRAHFSEAFISKSRL